MSVQPTNDWLIDYAKEWKLSRNRSQLHIDKVISPINYCFQGATTQEIQQHLIQHGMFSPYTNIQPALNAILKKKCWEVVQTEYERLRQSWGGPRVNIYIFLSDQNVRLLQQVFKGKSGLAYKEALFLFVSPYNDKDEWRALLTHEYHHALYMKKREESLNILDVMLMEGMAECAVRERYGDKILAPWTSIYKKEDSYRLWNQYIKRFQHEDYDHSFSRHLLYGGKGIPKWLGYFLGYQLVKQYVEIYHLPAHELIEIAQEEFLENAKWV